MIYMIGGPPKCGKTTLAKIISRENGISWISTDTLQNSIKQYVGREELLEKFPASRQRGESNDEKYSKYTVDEIIYAYQKQAKTMQRAIDMFVMSEVNDGNDHIIEGYHIEPELVFRLKEKYPNHIKSIFLIRSSKERSILDFKKSKTPNDWILTRTNESVTYERIADMICSYGDYFKEESKKYDLQFIDVDLDFKVSMEKSIKHLLS